MQHGRKDTEQTEEEEVDQILILSRRTKRKIINELELKNHLKMKFPNHKIALISMEDLPFSKQLEEMKKTLILIGIHGSGIGGNLIFLSEKKGGVIELFPFGFERPTFQNLCRKMGIRYEKWENLNRNATHFNPDILSSFSLSEAQKKDIIHSPRYRYDMPWAGNLYWIDQDTIVNVTQIEGLVRRLL